MLENTADYLVQDGAEIERILESLNVLRAPVSILFDGYEGSYVSVVIAVQPRDRLFFLDLLGLPEGRQRMDAGIAFTVQGALEGIPLLLENCRSAGRTQVHATEGYVIPFPERVAYLQRRDNFRARVPRATEVPFTLHGGRHRPPLHGWLDDISNLGCRLVFRDSPNPPLAEGELFSNLQIRAPAPYGEMSMAVEARHAEVCATSGRMISGFRFLDLKPAVRASIQRFVVYVQRETLRTQRR